MTSKTVKIIVATHKKYRMPNDEMYVPVQVGADVIKDSSGRALDLGYVKDNTGENISNLNPSFCELTGLYWAWKNVDADYIGLVHYRRHFGFSKTRDPFDGILTYEQLKPYLDYIRVFVPKKRKYYIETLYTHYAHTHYSEHLDITRDIIANKSPEYLKSYDRVVNHRFGYMFNMMIMEKELLYEYCEWLFDILFELRGKVDETQLTAFQKRFYGRISEIIFNVWLDYKLSIGEIKSTEVKELPFIYMEKTNWIKKAFSFMQAKFFGKKYEKSF